MNKLLLVFCLGVSALAFKFLVVDRCPTQIIDGKPTIVCGIKF